MHYNIHFRFICLASFLALTACSSNAPEPAQKSTQDPNAETSWHCEQGIQTWACKRRTIAEIQKMEAERRSKRFDWSLPEDDKSTTEPPLASTTTNQPKSPDAFDTAMTNVDAQRESLALATEPTALQEVPASYWAVQLIALGSQGELRAFIRDTQLDELIGAMINVRGKTWYVALLGVYETRAEAAQAAAERPLLLQRYEPYIRSMASLQAAMAEADRL